jgi:hypothetical protein
MQKQGFNVKQWLKDYGTLTALLGIALGLGVPGLYRLGAMSEQLRHLDVVLREDVKSDLRSLRDEIKLLRIEFAELRAEVKTKER